MTELAQAPSEAPGEESTVETSRKKGNGGPVIYPSWSRYFKKLVKTAESQTEVSQKLDLSQTQVSRWTRGLARPATLEAAVEAAVKLGGDGQEAATAFSADPVRTRGGARKTAAKKPGRKPGPKPGSRKATRSSTPEKAQSTPVRPIAAARSAQPARVAAVPDLPADVAEGIELPLTEQALGDLNDAIAAIATAERQLDHAVEAARTAGVAWPEIGQALARLNVRP